MATHVRPSLAPAIVAQQRLGLLARPLAIYLCKLHTGFTLFGKAGQDNTCTPPLVAKRLLGRIARLMAIVFVQAATQASS